MCLIENKSINAVKTSVYISHKKVRENFATQLTTFVA